MKIEYSCIDCGKPSGERTPSKFSQPREKYRCMSCAVKKYWKNPEYQKKFSDTRKKYFENPESRLKQSIATKKYYEENPESRIKLSVMATDRYKNPELLAKVGASQRKRYENSNEREKQSLLKKEYFKSNPGSREKLSRSVKKFYEDRYWYGSVKYYDGPQYCEKWNMNLRERVRAFFGYKCLECGTLRSGEKLHVHHVWYNKKLCCDDTPRSLVPLCRPCHAASNHNREYWSTHFQEILDVYYEGRCWLSREEYAALGTTHDNS